MKNTFWLSFSYVDAVRADCVYDCTRKWQEESIFGQQADFDAILVEPKYLDCLAHLTTESNLPLIFIEPFTVCEYKNLYNFGEVANFRINRLLCLCQNVCHTIFEHSYEPVW